MTLNPKAKNYTEFDLLKMLKRKFPPPAWALLPHVRNGTGLYANRTADAIAMSLWPSRGLSLYGFEIKVNRGDWLRELKNPQKAEGIGRYCDFWWMVCSPGVVEIGEVPPNWGLFVPKGRGLHVVKPASQFTAEKVDRVFLAALFRKVHESRACNQELSAEYSRGYEDGKQRGKDSVGWEVDRLRRDNKKVVEFEQASGIKIIDGWHDGEELGKAVRMILEGKDMVNITERDLNWLLERSKSIAKNLEDFLSEKKA